MGSILELKTEKVGCGGREKGPQKFWLNKALCPWLLKEEEEEELLAIVRGWKWRDHFL